MPHRLRERIFSGSTAQEAKALVAEIKAILEVVDEPVDYETLPSSLSHLSVWSADDLRDAETAPSILDDLELSVEAERPPSRAQAEANARATGYVPSSLVLEPEALARLSSCRSSIFLEYYARLGDQPWFIAIQKRILEHAREGVVESGERSRYQTVESFSTEQERNLGSVWTTTSPLRRPVEKKKPKRTTRTAKAGEVESVALLERLNNCLFGDDPFARDAFEVRLREAPDSVRAYATALMNDGAMADSKAALTLRAKPDDVALARSALQAILVALD